MDTGERFIDGLTNTVDVKQQERKNNCKLTEIPGSDAFNLTDSPEHIYKLLRTFDHGKNIFSHLVTTELNGSKIIIRRYKIIEPEEKQNDEYKLYFPYGQGKLLMLRYDILYGENAVGGVVNNIEQFYKFISELKTYKRHLTSNLLISENEVASLIDDEKMFYYYVPGKYINFWKKEWDFSRLYYYIANINDYDVPIIAGKIVCDLFCRKETEKNNAIRIALKNAGFNEYALFHKYEKKRDMVDSKIYSGEVVRGKITGFYELLRECFDIYTDLVPEPEEAERFLDGKICCSVVDEEGKIAGGTVITKKGSVETEEFIFVKDTWRGRGIARRIREYCQANAAKEVTRFISWIKDDNELSWRQIINLGYQKSNVYKITMMKG